MNNILSAILQGTQRGASLRGLVQMFAAKDPRVAQAQQMMAGKSEADLQKLCENMCRERNITPEDVARSLGIQIPSKR